MKTQDGKKMNKWQNNNKYYVMERMTFIDKFKGINEVKRRIMSLSLKTIMLVKPVMDKKIRKKKKKKIPMN